MPPPPRMLFKRKSSEIESAEQQRNPLHPFDDSSPSPFPGSSPIPGRSSPLSESRSFSSQAVASRPCVTGRPSQTSKSSSDALTPEQRNAIQILQREDPADQEKLERFMKGTLEYKLGALFKAHLKNERANASMTKNFRTSRKEGDLRAATRPIIRRRLILGRYDDEFWSNPGRVFLEDDFNDLEGAVQVVGKVRVEEKAKLKDRLLRAQGLVKQPLKAFADCLRCEVGNVYTQYVQDSPDLWEAAARWRWVLLQMKELRDIKFWSKIDKIFAEVDDSWEFYQQDVDDYGFEEANTEQVNTEQVIDPELFV